MMASASFNALNKPYPAALLVIIRMFVLYIPLAYLGSKTFDLIGIFVAAAVANLLSGLGSGYWIGKTVNRLKCDTD